MKPIESGLIPIKSGLTKLESDAKIKKGKEIYSLDLEGNIRKIAAIKEKKRQEPRKKSVDLGYLNIGYYLVTPIVAGVFLGLGIDYWLKTKPFFVVLFLFLGTLGSFYNLFKLLIPTRSGLKER